MQSTAGAGYAENWTALARARPDRVTKSLAYPSPIVLWREQDMAEYTEVKSKFGPVFVRAGDKNFIYICSNPENGSDSIRVHGVQYVIGVRLTRWKDGKFHCGVEDSTERWREPWMSRVQFGAVGKEVSNSARQAVRGEVERIANEYDAGNGEAMLDAEFASLQRVLERARGEEESAAVEYQKKQEETMEAVLAIEKFKVAREQAGSAG